MIPKSLDNKNKVNRVRYLLDVLKKDGKIYNDAKSRGSCWKTNLAIIVIDRKIICYNLIMRGYNVKISDSYENIFNKTWRIYAKHQRKLSYWSS